MSNLIRWEPGREMLTLREAMDRLFDSAFTRSSVWGGGFQAPAVDLYQTDEDVVVKTNLPGLKAEDVDISIAGDLLTIRGEFKEKDEKKEKSYHLREQRYGSFERTLSLPVDVMADKAKADFADGVLTITLPKAEAAKPRTITIKAK